ncbi:MAG: ATP-binding cassette domain-containing protein, partial [Gemmatimonadota bacterium]
MTVTPVLSAQSIRRAYPLAGRSVEAVRGLSLDVMAGEWVAVVGPSGCGKSTLLNLLGAIAIEPVEQRDHLRPGARVELTGG